MACFRNRPRDVKGHVYSGLHRFFLLFSNSLSSSITTYSHSVISFEWHCKFGNNMRLHFLSRNFISCWNAFYLEVYRKNLHEHITELRYSWIQYDYSIAEYWEYFYHSGKKRTQLTFYSIVFSPMVQEELTRPCILFYNNFSMTFCKNFCHCISVVITLLLFFSFYYCLFFPSRLLCFLPAFFLCLCFFFIVFFSSFVSIGSYYL